METQENRPSQMPRDEMHRRRAVSYMESAAEAVGKIRSHSHGTMVENFALTAALWSAWLNITILPSDVAHMMSLLKKSRAKAGDPLNKDHYTDDIGYSGIAGVLAHLENSNEVDPNAA